MESGDELGLGVRRCESLPAQLLSPCVAQLPPLKYGSPLPFFCPSIKRWLVK